jgi:hypothetical protein
MGLMHPDAGVWAQPPSVTKLAIKITNSVLVVIGNLCCDGLSCFAILVVFHRNRRQRLTVRLIKAVEIHAVKEPTDSRCGHHNRARAPMLKNQG